AIVEAVAAAIEELDLPRVVVDPVMVAKGGSQLVDDEAIETIRTELLPKAMVITPNADEAAVLLNDEVRTMDQARAAARRLKDLGPAAVIVKGGHLDGALAIDVLFDGVRLVELRAPRIDTTSTHGTGCTFASAIAANLALGQDLKSAAEHAKAYVTEAIRRAPAIGSGHGPLGHFR
ncbi:MAG: bifunctional hydroxymethylpyrimidine kinase/phosphomethylpyrimidine kinase, partial [Acidobacteriota bacterium]